MDDLLEYQVYDLCFTKNIIYLITCKICERVYVGQSKRTVRSRITEDLTGVKEFLYLHSKTHDVDCVKLYKWKIISVISDLSRRLAAEGLYTRLNEENLINGCKGKEFLPFLSVWWIFYLFMICAFLFTHTHSFISSCHFLISLTYI